MPHSNPTDDLPSPRLLPELLREVLAHADVASVSQFMLASRAFHDLGLPFLWRTMILNDTGGFGDTVLQQRVRWLLWLGRTRDALQFVRTLRVAVYSWFPELNEFLAEIMPHVTRLTVTIETSQTAAPILASLRLATRLRFLNLIPLDDYQIPRDFELPRSLRELYCTCQQPYSRLWDVVETSGDSLVAWTAAVGEERFRDITTHPRAASKIHFLSLYMHDFVDSRTIESILAFLAPYCGPTLKMLDLYDSERTSRPLGPIFWDTISKFTNLSRLAFHVPTQTSALFSREALAGLANLPFGLRIFINGKLSFDMDTSDFAAVREAVTGSPVGELGFLRENEEEGTLPDEYWFWKSVEKAVFRDYWELFDEGWE